MLKLLVKGLLIGIFLGLAVILLGTFALFAYGAANAPLSKQISIASLKIADITFTNSSFQMHLNPTGLLSICACLTLISISTALLTAKSSKR